MPLPEEVSSYFYTNIFGIGDSLHCTGCWFVCVWGGGWSGGRVEVEVEGRLLLLVFVCALLTRAWRFETQHFFFLRLPFLQDSVVVLKTNVSVML